MMEALGEGVEHIVLAHGVTGLALKLGSMMVVPVVRGMRANGMRTVDDLATAAMLHPELYRTLISKVPAKRGDLIGPVIRQQLVALAMRQAVPLAQPAPVQRNARPTSYGIATPPYAPPVGAFAR